MKSARYGVRVSIICHHTSGLGGVFLYEIIQTEFLLNILNTGVSHVAYTLTCNSNMYVDDKLWVICVIQCCTIFFKNLNVPGVAGTLENLDLDNNLHLFTLLFFHSKRIW